MTTPFPTTGPGYRVTVTAGAHTWEAVGPDGDPGYGLADPLVIGWRIPDDAPRPAQPEATTMTFSVVVEDAADVSDLVVGTLVEAVVEFAYDGASGGRPVRFAGRIGQLTAAPHPQGMVYVFTCVDPTADLAELLISTSDNPSTASIAGHFEAYLDAGIEWYDWSFPPGWEDEPTPVLVRAQRQADVLHGWLVGLLDSYAYDMANLGRSGPENLARLIVSPGPTPGDTWALDPVPESYAPAPGYGLPARFAQLDGGGWGPRFDPDPVNGAIDATVVSYAATWAATKPRVVNQAVVVYLEGAGLADPGVARTVSVDARPDSSTPVIVERRETSLYHLAPAGASAAMAADVARLILRPVTPTNGWAPDGFTWLLYADPAALADFPAMFPDHTVDPDSADDAPYRTLPYVRPVAVTGIPAHQNPARTGGWFAGQLSEATLRIAEGKPRIEFKLTPGLPRPVASGGAALTWAALAATHPTVTHDQLDPGYSWADYRTLSNR